MRVCVRSWLGRTTHNVFVASPLRRGKYLTSTAALPVRNESIERYLTMTVSTILRFPIRTCTTNESLLLATCLAVAVSAICPADVRGAAITGATVNWRIAAKEEALTHAHDNATMMGAMWDVPAQRRAERTMPWIEVANDPTSDANVTEFRMTIGDERFNFSNDLFANFTVISPTSDTQNFSTTTEDMDNTLVVMFDGNGLAPGQTVRFRIDIGIDAGQTAIMNIWPHPDYRTVLFDMNGIDAYGPTPMTPMPPDESDNSMATVTFRNASGMMATSSCDPNT